MFVGLLGFGSSQAVCSQIVWRGYTYTSFSFIYAAKSTGTFFEQKLHATYTQDNISCANPAIAMADAAPAVVEEEQEPAVEEGEEDGVKPLLIETVTRVKLGDRRPWFPEVHEVDGRSFVTLSKTDPGLCLIATGKSMNRHSKRDAWSLNVEWWHTARQLSNSFLASDHFKCSCHNMKGSFVWISYCWKKETMHAR